MKKNIYSLCLLFILWLTSGCEKEDKPVDDCISTHSVTNTSKQAEDDALLTELSTEIYGLSGSATCQRANLWGIASIGVKPCGGPAAYIPYRLEIDVDCFLKKINHYTLQTEKYNKKYGLISDCSVLTPPKAVSCQSGIPVFVY